MSRGSIAYKKLYYSNISNNIYHGGAFASMQHFVYFFTFDILPIV